ncbi:hypothetical protein EDB89DRAFT_2071705 [Lactarius sanguifluus]|nr:hypothetical protein EDB89DRAFT_2071705 [Lactarius sanguifluus]
MNADPLVLVLVEDSDKVFSKALYAELHVKEVGKPIYPREDMFLFKDGYYDRPRLDRAVNELRDVSVKAEIHRYHSVVTAEPDRDQREYWRAAQNNPQWEHEVCGATAVLEHLLESWEYGMEHIWAGRAVSSYNPRYETQHYQEPWE